MRKSFVFNCEWQEVLMEYPAEVRLEVYDAIIEYAASGKLLELKPLAKMAFSFIKKEIDSNNARYDETVKKRSEAGKKGMASRYGSRVTAGGDMCGQDGAEEKELGKDLTSVTKGNKRNKGQQAVTNVTNVTDNDYVYDDDYVSTEVDGETRARAKPAPPSATPSVDDEVKSLRKDKTWTEQACMLHHTDRARLMERLEEFRLQCHADGKKFHNDMADAKQHFNNWLRIVAGKEREKDVKTESESRNRRRGTRLCADEAKTYGSAF